MRLTELDPRWIGFGSYQSVPEFQGKRWHIGISFNCPHCIDQRIAVFFSNAIDDGVAWAFSSWDILKEIQKRNLWQRTGESFEDLSLLPSIDASACGH